MGRASVGEASTRMAGGGNAESAASVKIRPVGGRPSNCPGSPRRCRCARSRLDAPTGSMANEQYVPTTSQANVRLDHPPVNPPSAPAEFNRLPAPTGNVREAPVTSQSATGEIVLSGLAASAASPPRGLIVALHGSGMHAGYYHAPVDPSLSLLELAATVGFDVWAPDRPGSGASAHLGFVPLAEQATMLLDAIDAYTDGRDVGAGVVLVAHSYGLKVALTMAATERGARLLGLDGAGTGSEYTEFPPRRVEPEERARGHRGPAWGPEVLYPAGTFARGGLPLDPTPIGDRRSEGRAWPQMLAEIGPRITIPVRLTFAEHEGFWRTDAGSMSLLRRHLRNAVPLTIEAEPGAGHNTSLGLAARAYHLKVVAFAESCVLRRQMATN